MIERIRIQNYKALRDVTLNLTPIHVLIGANDTGKTSILEAIAALCRSADHRLSHAFLGRRIGRKLVWHESPNVDVEFNADLYDRDKRFTYRLFPNEVRRLMALAAFCQAG